MFFSRWTLYQAVIIILLVVLSFIADIFKEEIAIPFSSSMETNTPMLITFLFVVTVIGLLSLLMYFQTKKSDTFLKHPLWDKMHILMPFLFVISLIVIFSFFLIEPLSDLVQNNRWMIYVLFYYVLFLINATVLSIIHKTNRNRISNENKVKFSFVWTSLALFLIIFIL
ncbi:hypothetical protein CIL05_02880 [Virgibacillus profundi]|uniref:Uncharacterized protein n=1 Tax=Virgibacillus profundi TaxID=2024555 RepID=A0A2A2IJ20_9BACI|nr:hypothetical protein [Virgibacillus profundi]PAV31617.1 hypothetical protein CIL05_02880 [Virgibacillus profundi]PXY55803.1 hypothetical protein CIT14_02885 [Virgibacillus profundi]